MLFLPCRRSLSAGPRDTQEANSHSAVGLVLQQSSGWRARREGSSRPVSDGGGARAVGGITRAELAKVGGSLPGREGKRGFPRVGTVRTRVWSLGRRPRARYY